MAEAPEDRYTKTTWRVELTGAPELLPNIIEAVDVASKMAVTHLPARMSSALRRLLCDLECADVETPFDREPLDPTDFARPARDGDWPGYLTRIRRLGRDQLLVALEAAARRLGDLEQNERIRGKTAELERHLMAPFERPTTIVFYAEGLVEPGKLPDLPGVVYVPAYGLDTIAKAVRI